MFWVGSREAKAGSGLRLYCSSDNDQSFHVDKAERSYDSWDTYQPYL